MNSQEPMQRNKGAWTQIGVGLAAGLLGAALGLAIALAVLDSGRAPAEPEVVAPDNSAAVEELRSQVQELKAQLDEATSRPVQVYEPAAAPGQVEKLRGDLVAAQEREDIALAALSLAQSELELATEEQAGLRQELRVHQSQAAEESARLDTLQEMYDSLEDHRALLLELRREMPTDRDESLAYWSNIHRVAVDANPALSSEAEKVLIRIDNYYTWKDGGPDPSDSVDEYLDWREAYAPSGAEAYEEATLIFNQQALLSVVNRIDTVLALLDQ
ncbi:MAG: hypothetical protein OYI31_00455 [Chloroflexota bacterium]|nr:hypothetical protein [Chloroflexota bacterium]MDE2940743.1 hypothetical protein [Chloroflexota bacterium]MDE3266925.1 hypothetical protein [Chloroflexota bacterium]